MELTLTSSAQAQRAQEPSLTSPPVVELPELPLLGTGPSAADTPLPVDMPGTGLPVPPLLGTGLPAEPGLLEQEADSGLPSEQRVLEVPARSSPESPHCCSRHPADSDTQSMEGTCQ